ncbi:hypothetical protein L798_15358 [Zootermopsis nevadensis]|uniref:Uncharacterized protein n=1 Tax=Zootermopsis nevadensis TaxID=136037 RepID=A0A067R0E2_ZOONE|nr:hypothetical protein L798_15358 [Zootermopsis nevadensis]
MKFVYQIILCVTMVTSMHFTPVQGQLFNLGVLDRIRNIVHGVLHNTSNQQSQYTSKHFPTVQPLTQGTLAYIPVSSESVQHQGAITQDSGNGTVQGVPESRSMIRAPLRDGGCETGYRKVNGQCRKEYGRRRRRR